MVDSFIRLVRSQWRRHLIVIAGFALATGGITSVIAELTPPRHELEFFETHIRPLLVQRCFECHSATHDATHGGLRVDSRDALLKGGNSGAALVPGNPGESSIVALFSRSATPASHPVLNPELEERELEHLRRWVTAGALWPEPRPSTRDDGPYDWAVEQTHWSFRAVKNPRPPAVPQSYRTKNAIDRFVVARLHDAGLPQPQPAPARLFVRRAYFDLIGLPPSPDALDEWTERLNQGPGRSLSDRGVEELIDALLARPEYGERWGRHWLDVARYSDTGGWTQDRGTNPKAYHYRDWVVDAINTDLPFADFIKGQLAGDQLSERAPIATGFLALGPKYSSDGGDPDSIAQAKGETLDDRVDTFSRAFLGLTVSCARCHDHKFDPIPIEDYYSIAGIFNNTGEGETPLVEDAIVRAYHEAQREIKEQQDALNKRRNESKKLEGEAATLAKAEVEKMQAALDRVKAAAPPKYDFAHSSRDTGDKDMHVALRGNLLKEGDLAPRQFLRILGGATRQRFTEGSGRKQLAEAVADPTNPLTARVFVNRVWLHHFGRALVRSPDNFGTLGQRPTHPLLLDWLASEFLGAGGSLKNLHRVIMRSATYRSSSATVDGGMATDADNRLLWRMNPRRMDVETWRDSLLSVTGELDQCFGGHSVDNIAQSARRTLYSKVSRNDPTPSDRFLRLFDFPIPRASAAERTQNVIPQQFLFMLNSPFMIERAKAFAGKLKRTDGTPTEQIRRSYVILYGREPTENELRAGEAFFMDVDTGDQRLDAWVQYYQVLLSANEFMYIR